MAELRALSTLATIIPTRFQSTYRVPQRRSLLQGLQTITFVVEPRSMPTLLSLAVPCYTHPRRR